MSADDARGKEFFGQAVNKLTSSSWFTSKSSKLEDAVELFAKAANSFKLAKNWEEAAKSFLEAAKCHIELKSRHEAASAYNSAGQCYRKVPNMQGACEAMDKACSLYLDDGRFGLAAKGQKDIGEMCEAENDLERAIEHFEKAADYYETDNSSANSGTMRLKVAHFYARLGNFQSALEIFESNAIASSNDKLLKYGAKDNFLKAGMCALAFDDLVRAQEAIDKYASISFEFKGSREMKFLEELVDATKANDLDSFELSIREFDKISRLDPWKVNVLQQVKALITKNTSGGGAFS